MKVIIYFMYLAADTFMIKQISNNSSLSYLFLINNKLLVA